MRLTFPIIAALAVLLLSLAAPAVSAQAGTLEYGDLDIPQTEGEAVDPPSSFDLRDVYGEMPVRDQGSSNLCWAFSTAAVVEYRLIKEGYDPAMVSPYQLAWDGYTGTGMDRVGDGDEFRYLIADMVPPNVGGYDWTTMVLLTNWLGPVAEEAAPFENLETGVPVDPGAYGTFPIHVTGTSVYDPADDVDAVKSRLMSGDAGMLLYNASHRTLLGGDQLFYCPEGLANHGVLLLGWDDDFPAEAFSIEPPGDGAWLIRNSWGSDGYSGYGWVSYYSAGNSAAMFIDTVMENDPDANLYSYDRGYSIGQDMPFEGTATAANVFTAEGDELLGSVSFTTYTMAGVDYSVQVYTGLSDPSDPCSGTPALESPVTGTTGAAGCVWVPLGCTVPLDEGETFSVCVTFEDDGTVYVPLDTYELFYLEGVPEYVTDPVAEAGQSFVLIDGEWTDVSADGSTNVRIRAITTDSETSAVPFAVAAVIIAAVAAGLAARRD